MQEGPKASVMAVDMLVPWFQWIQHLHGLEVSLSLTPGVPRPFQPLC